MTVPTFRAATCACGLLLSLRAVAEPLAGELAKNRAQGWAAQCPACKGTVTLTIQETSLVQPAGGH